METDILIIGGGPAGSTLASLLLRYRPQTRVTVVERAAFPRFHVGETLVSDINRVLHEMGAWPAVEATGFVRKYGATFRWGVPDEPWDMLFAGMDALRPDAPPGGPEEVQTAWTFHVDRARYDQVLLDHARSLGAEVLFGTVSALLEEEGRVVGALVDGQPRRARMVVDATGQSGLMGSLAERELDPHLRNVAWWGYFRGFSLEPALNGTLDRSRAFIVAHPVGWSWYFPIRPDLVSVGVVTTLEAHRQRTVGDDEAFFREALAGCPDIARLLQDAELVPYAPDLPRVHRIADFSYISRSIVKPGLVRVGDAAGFVDPILSVGCFLGQNGARLLAYSLLSLLRGDSGFTEDELLASYAEQVREVLSAYREITWFFYRFNERPEAWWARARELVQDAGLPRRATDLQAFTAFASGFAARRGVVGEPTRQFDEPFLLDAFRRLVDPQAEPTPPARLAPDTRPALVGPCLLSERAVPVDGTGRMIRALRVEVQGGRFDEAETAFVRRMMVPLTMRPLFGLLDGSRDLPQLQRELGAQMGLGPAHEADLGRYLRTVLTGLQERGLLKG